MKKERVIFCLFFFVFSSFFFVSHINSSQGYYPWDTSFIEKINSYDVQIKLEKNSDLIVQEKIYYNFDGYKKHGIYRYIPLKKPEGGKIRIEDVRVTDEVGNPYKLKVFRVGTLNPTLYIRVGDPHRLVTGSHFYVISYRVSNALFFDDKGQAEIYWNAIGPDWKVPIEDSKVKLIFPERISSDSLSVNCYTGLTGSYEENCHYYISRDGKEIDFYLFSSLQPHQAFSIKVDIPKNTVNPPSISRIIFWKIKDNFLWLIPLLSFIFLFIEWQKRGRDPRIPKVIVPQYYPPDNLKPLLMGALWKEKTTSDMITATIIDLAVRGFLLIKETKEKFLKFFSREDYILVRREKEDSLLADYEKDILETIFSGKNEVSLSEIRKRRVDFNNLQNRISKKVFSELVSNGYFPEDPLKLKKPLVLIGAILMATAFVLFGEFPQYNYNYLLLVAGVTGIIFFGFGMIMPRRTKKGGKTYLKILGFREFIRKVDKYRAQFEERENIFEKYLPYAILFGCTKKWLNAFKDIYKNPPNWYVSSAGSYSFSDFETSMSLLSSSLSSSVGGGSGGAGGGSGGGGGGSW